jgi:tetratricopeptide (TPR) repeat protein
MEKAETSINLAIDQMRSVDIPDELKGLQAFMLVMKAQLYLARMRMHSKTGAAYEALQKDVLRTLHEALDTIQNHQEGLQAHGFRVTGQVALEQLAEGIGDWREMAGILKRTGEIFSDPRHAATARVLLNWIDSPSDLEQVSDLEQADLSLLGKYAADMKESNPQRSLQCLDALIQSDAADGNLFLVRASVHQHLGSWNECLADATTSERLDPWEDDAYTLQSNALDQLNRPEDRDRARMRAKVAKALRKVLSKVCREGDVAALRQALGQETMEEHKFSSAYKTAQAVLWFMEGNVDGYRSLLKALGAVGTPRKILRCFRCNASYLDPKKGCCGMIVGPMIALASMDRLGFLGALLDRGDQSLGDPVHLPFLEFAVQAFPAAVPFRLRLARGLLYSNQIESTKTHLEQAKKVSPELPLVAFEEGLLALAEGRVQEARRAFEETRGKAWKEVEELREILRRAAPKADWDRVLDFNDPGPR